MRWARVALPDGSLSYAEVEAEVAHLLGGAPWLGARRTGVAHPLAALRLVCPVEPTKVLCVGRNYQAHAKELGHDVPKEPLFFLKPPSSLLDPGGTIELPPESARVDHEAEVGVVIGKRARHVPEASALEHVLGYTAVGDITARDLQTKDGQWTRAKGFDTFCPVGPYVVPASALDPCALDVSCRVNGEQRQQGNTRDMIFPIARLVAAASRIMTLEPGDLLVTGTPEGVGPLAAGDRLAIEVSGVGVLELTVAAARS